MFKSTATLTRVQSNKFRSVKVYSQEKRLTGQKRRRRMFSSRVCAARCPTAATQQSLVYAHRCTDSCWFWWEKWKIWVLRIQFVVFLIVGLTHESGSTRFSNRLQLLLILLDFLPRLHGRMNRSDLVKKSAYIRGTDWRRLLFNLR